MLVPENRRWMYNRTYPGPGLRPLNPEFVNGVEEFVNYACQSSIYISEGTIRCPCVKCYSGKLLKPEIVKVHLFKKGFKPGYWYWTDHGEVQPDPVSVDSVSTKNSRILGEENEVGRNQNMVYDAATHDPIVPNSATQANTSGQATKPRNKTFIEPDGDFAFLPSKPAAKAITKVIQSRYDHPWPSWGKIPKKTRETWFKEFQVHVWWMPQHHVHMWRAYNSRSSKRLSDLLGKARELNQRPLWIREDIWEDLCRHWGTSAYKEKCQQAKRNRASDPARCLHTGGCISTGTHAQKLAKAWGRKPTVDEVFRHLHLRKANREWVATKAKQTYVSFKAKQAALLSQPSNKRKASTIPMRSQELQIQTDGEIKKARVCDLGSQASSYEHGESSSSKSASSELPEHVINEVKKQLQQEMEAQIQQVRQEIDSKWKRRFQQYQRKQERRLGNMLKSYLSSNNTQLGNQRIAEKNEEDNDDDDDDDDYDDGDDEHVE